MFRNHGRLKDFRELGQAEGLQRVGLRPRMSVLERGQGSGWVLYFYFLRFMMPGP